jgi:hypothetical protein
MHTHRYDEYIERHGDDNIYQEEIEVHQNFMVFDEADLSGSSTPGTTGDRLCPKILDMNGFL